MKKALIAYVATLVTFLLLDGIWLGLLMAPTYRELLGPLMLEKPLLVPAAVFYCLYVFGCVVFVVLPASSWQRAAKMGALLGLVAYGTYDLTNWATLRGWSVQVTLMDWAWGTFATAVACTVGFSLAAGKRLRSQSESLLTERTSSRASPLPQGLMSFTSSEFDTETCGSEPARDGWRSHPPFPADATDELNVFSRRLFLSG